MEIPLIDFSKITGFEWDAGNKRKNWLRRRVEDWECEGVFFGRPLLIYPDERHSQKETRYFALGMTQAGRQLFLSFTIRGDRLRVISARGQNRKERRVYEKR
ncbi:MAG: BrnT family toxin [Candidatus Omnitrophica bacterium]|nr:BrnT family toxin [Candidatus Omnitrophota bacterium]